MLKDKLKIVVIYDNIICIGYYYFWFKGILYRLHDIDMHCYFVCLLEYLV